MCACVCVVDSLYGAATCTDTFVRFTDLAAQSAGQTQPAGGGITSVDDCRDRCMNDTRCAGFNWIRDGRDPSQNCLLYDLDVGDANTVSLFDLYARERCEPSMFITFAPGMQAIYTSVRTTRRQLGGKNSEYLPFLLTRIEAARWCSG